ncbi:MULTISPECIES: class I SAM-dependent methyltransferase family protein [unclassified Methanosarcina]|uniref:class I SAM-dependent methyltransferase n=1 Tax=unclassified Methanosarcina TaxID=2644672 RepID=UPI00061552C8|nr:MULTISPECIES: class I SAM-dependent methyltransferase family protein [unclassified Methanosarcina]AKB18007.1 tRNA (guanine(37)-N1)-methyltransferase Trm5b [Methanosarcina sp. WWM596]AKB21346.1 tRNA (guanine(37)-N1)-methyltransferase Trm5b [Methanosarcina sp. WH1]
MSFRDRVTLRDAMRGIVEPPLLPLVPKRFDYVGDIVVVSIPEELEAYRDSIVSKILSMRGNTRAVLNKVSKLEGEHRVARFEFLSGESAETFHRENGYTYRMDVRKVFFNPRLYWERARVASKVLPGESVLIPFAGVGPFVLPSAGKGAVVCAIEINPDACGCLKENVRLNRLEKQVTVIQGDAELILRHAGSLNPYIDLGNVVETESVVSPSGIACSESGKIDGFQIPEKGFDRAIMPTPYGMDHFLGEVSGLVRRGGHIHFYTFKTDSQIPELIEEYKKMGLEVEFYRRCGNVAPGVSRWVFDLLKKMSSWDVI